MFRYRSAPAKVRQTVLFGSFEFLFGFLPVTLAGYHGLRLYGRRSEAKMFLVLASLFFYGWWDLRYVLLVAVSVAVNFGAGLLLAPNRGRRVVPCIDCRYYLQPPSLGLLQVCKFLFGEFRRFDWAPFTIGTIVLPLGISFFTFQQIVYLVETARDGRCELNIVNYTLFVIFFPHLIAGPITHPREMLPQFEIAASKQFDIGQLNVGMAILVLGLAKKAVIADTLAFVVNPIFCGRHGWICLQCGSVDGCLRLHVPALF